MKKNILIFVTFIFLVTILTFPLVFKITTYIPGFFSSDEPFAGLWDNWRIKHSLENNLPLKFTSLIAHPFGVDLDTSGYKSFLWSGWHYLLSLLTSPILNWNIQILLNLLLSGIFTYFFVFYLSESRLAGMLSGVIFSLSPYQFIRIWQHLGLTYNQWIPLVLLSVILLWYKPSKRRWILLLLALLLLFSFDYSIMYFGGMVLFSFLFYILIYNWRIKLFKEKKLLKHDIKFLSKVIGVILIALFILLPQFYPVIKNRLQFSSTSVASVFNPYHRPFEDLFSQSAKPLSYLLPATVHPIFGKFTERFVGSPLYGISFTEHTLYLGWIPLILAFVAFRTWRRKRKQLSVVSCQLSDKREDFYIGFFIFLAIVAWLFSQPPWWKIGPIKIYMPSFFMYKILPMYRAYCRFGIVVMLAVAVLAGFGLDFILERFKSQKTKIALACLFSGLVLFEFWNWPPYKVIDVSGVPSVYYWLKEQPGDFAIAEYPLDADSPNEMYKFYQTKHEKKIINGTFPGTYANQVTKTIFKLSQPSAAGVLKWMGVRYVLVHKEDYLKSELTEDREELDKIPKNAGLKFIKSFPAQECPQKDVMCVQKTGPIDVYGVVAEPMAPLIKKN